jgi:hypothetical protein
LRNEDSKKNYFDRAIIIIEKFGLPTFIVVLFFFSLNYAIVPFVEKYGSEEQKHDFIEKYVLFRDFPNTGVVFIVGIVIVSLFIMQHNAFKKRQKAEREELKRLREYEKKQRNKHK